MDWKATSLPSSEIDGVELGADSCPPLEVTLARSVAPVVGGATGGSIVQVNDAVAPVPPVPVARTLNVCEPSPRPT